MIPVSELEHMSEQTLINIYKTLNYWGWSWILGEKPEGWDEMPNYRKPYMGECLTKADIIRPYMRVIQKKVPHYKLQIRSLIQT